MPIGVSGEGISDIYGSFALLSGCLAGWLGWQAATICGKRSLMVHLLAVWLFGGLAWLAGWLHQRETILDGLFALLSGCLAGWLGCLAGYHLRETIFDGS